MRLVACACKLSLALALPGCRPPGAPAALAPAADPAPELRTLADAEAWFASRFAALVGASVVTRSDPGNEGPAYAQHMSDVYEDARLADCVLHYTIDRSRVEFPANPRSGTGRSRARVSIPLRDLDPSRLALRQVRDTNMVRQPFVVELRTTAAAGPTMTTRREGPVRRERRTLRHGATGLHVASREAGAVVVGALAAAARLCGAATPPR